MAQAVEQREYDRFFSQARLDIECWQREVEREIPPPYWREPKLPSFSEHVDLVAQEGGVREQMRVGEGQGYTNGDDSASGSQVPRQKVLPSGPRIQYPPPSYYAH